MDDLEKPELTLLQISDLHFGPPYRKEAGEAVLRLASQLPLDAIIVSGDLTQRAKREQFEAARDFLSHLPSVPQLVIPGNHDVPLYRFFERMLTPHRLYQQQTGILCLSCTETPLNCEDDSLCEGRRCRDKSAK